MYYSIEFETFFVASVDVIFSCCFHYTLYPRAFQYYRIIIRPQNQLRDRIAFCLLIFQCILITIENSQLLLFQKKKKSNLIHGLGNLSFNIKRIERISKNVN